MSWYREKVNALLIDIRNGDKSKGDVLFSFTSKILRKVAYHYTFDKDQVEDVLMEAYIKIFRSIGSFNEEKDGFNWMYRIVQTTAFDKNEKNDHFTTVAYNDEIAISDEGFEENVVLKESVENALSHFSKEDGDFVRLYFYNDFTIKKIAEVTGVPKSTVHSRLKKILKEIKKYF